MRKRTDCDCVACRTAIGVDHTGALRGCTTHYSVIATIVWFGQTSSQKLKCQGKGT